jgi:hypothetical protein
VPEGLDDAELQRREPLGIAVPPTVLGASTDEATVARITLWSFAAAVAAIITAPAHAQSRKPTAPEIAAIRNCVTKSKDDVDAGEQQCLFKLVANPCMGSPGNASDAVMADCYRIDGKIWDAVLYDADWFKQCGVSTVAMESTGVYWIPVFEILEQRGFTVLLVNARDAKHVPGRKT